MNLFGDDGSISEEKWESIRKAFELAGKLKDKINQIISLLVPMFVISYKKAEDLAYAMEARGYIPGKERTKLEVLKYKASDYITYVFLALFIAFIICGKILQVI